MKKRIRYCLVIAICFVTIATGISVARHEYSLNRNAIDRYGDFWEDPSKYEVWFMGSSHVYYSIHPMWLWEKYGITSYDISTPSAPLPTTYWLMKCALEKGNPKVIVLDTYYTDIDEKRVDSYGKTIVEKGFFLDGERVE